MKNNNNHQASTEKGKQAPPNVSANTEAQAKEETDPIKEDGANGADQDEGEMNNGELGAGLDNK